MKTTLLLTLLLAVPGLSFGQAPPLGTASTYGAFTAIGAFNNTGATNITGNIGTNLGAVTGFPPGTHTGIRAVEDGDSDQAAKDVDAAYSAMSLNTTGTALGPALGGGQTLTPGVYLLSTAATLSGDLKLDGLGDANAGFIIRINGALSAAAATHVRLLNSASWSKVYWQVAGRVDIGENSAFKGTLLVNGDINMMLNATLQGRALTRTGTITLNTNNISTAAADIPLPVKLTSFTAERQGETALLRWTTATEQNNAYFALESSADGQHFGTIGRVSGTSNSTLARTYQWADTRLAEYSASQVYYRLRQVDTDSSTHYSPVRMVALAPLVGLQMQAFPSPSQLPANLLIQAEQAGPATLRLTDALGHLVATRRLILNTGSNSVPLNEGPRLAPGLYLAHLQQGGQRQALRFVQE